MPEFNPKVGDLVYFKWEDHCSYTGSAWRPIKEIGELLTPSYCETVGFVIGITRNEITTVANVSGEDGSQVATRLRRAITQGKIIKRF